MSKVYGFGDPDGFVFNMSVGYDWTASRAARSTPISTT